MDKIISSSTTIDIQHAVTVELSDPIYDPSRRYAITTVEIRYRQVKGAWEPPTFLSGYRSAVLQSGGLGKPVHSEYLRLPRAEVDRLVAEHLPKSPVTYQIPTEIS